MCRSRAHTHQCHTRFAEFLGKEEAKSAVPVPVQGADVGRSSSWQGKAAGAEMSQEEAKAAHEFVKKFHGDIEAKDMQFED